MKDKYTQLVKELAEEAMALGGSNYSQTASVLEPNGKPLSRQSFFKMVKNGSLRMAVFLEMLDALGLEMIVRKQQ